MLPFVSLYPGRRATNMKAMILPGGAGNYFSTPPTLGAEVFANPSFTTDTVWTKEPGWTISGGNAVGTAVTGFIHQDVDASLTAGADYALAPTTVTVTGGTLYPILKGKRGTAITATGTYQSIVLNDGVTSVSGFEGVGFTGTIASTSAKKLGVLDIYGNISILDYSASTDWTPASRGAPLSKQDAYTVRLDASGVRVFNLKNAEGGAFITISSTAVLPASDGQAVHTLTTYQANDGSGNRVTKFYYSLNGGTTYTQLGSTVTTAAPANINVSANGIGIGATNNGSADFFIGKIFKAPVWKGLVTVDGSGILDTSGATPVANPDVSLVAAGANSFIDSTGLTWTRNGNARIG